MSNYHPDTMTHRLLYQVTLASGRIITRPEDFGDGELPTADDYFWPAFAEDGRLLPVEAEDVRQTQSEPPSTYQT